MQARLEGQADPLRCVVLTRGGRFVVTCGDGGTAYVWDLAALRGSRRKEQQTHTTRVRAVSRGWEEVYAWGLEGCVTMR